MVEKNKERKCFKIPYSDLVSLLSYERTAVVAVIAKLHYADFPVTYPDLLQREHSQSSAGVGYCRNGSGRTKPSISLEVKTAVLKIFNL